MISIIIPTYNEEEHIAKIILSLKEKDATNALTEIIISDGGSTDDTIKEALKAGATVVSSPLKGRGAQMNYGASLAKGSVLYFIHADTLPPDDFAPDILNAIYNNHSAGCFRLSFDHSHWFLKANCWFTRFDVTAVRFGDQSLFEKREIFEKAGGFNEDLIVLEDQEIIKRIRKICRFTIIQKPVLTSARKYIANGIFRTQGIFFLIYFMYRFGYSQQKLVSTYRKLIKQDKL